MTAAFLSELIGGQPLNARETHVLVATAQGYTAAETGKQMFLATETVKQYRKRIIAKMGARNMAHAVAIGIGAGLINMESVLEDAA